MVSPVDSPFLVPFDGSFALAESPTEPEGGAVDKKKLEKRLKKKVKSIAKRQEALYADDRYALLLVFQAMDAAGKDGTIRAVTTGVNPAGFQVSSFKKPSAEELDHDFLWRTSRALPERGRIGIFNRSYYEEVLVVRVHPEYLGGQRLPSEMPLQQRWASRYASIRSHEQHLADNGVQIIKFWLNVSQQEQHRRFVARIDEPDKNWKFSPGDVAESGHWSAYMEAYEDALNETSRPAAPWYAIPADSKPFMRLAVADIIERTLQAMPLRYPEPSAEVLEGMAAHREQLVAGLADDE